MSFLAKSYRSACLPAILAITLVNGCNDGEPNRSSKLPAATQLETLSVEQQKLKEQAVAAKDQLFQALLGELVRSMGEKGPAKSIAVCRELAPKIAKQVSAETGVKIGRTSFKLRNPDNTAPDWAVPFVNSQVEREVAVELPENGLGLLLPIRLQTTCTLCHGSDEQISPDVKAAIVSNYPQDRATGFAEGDIRGYFWIEAH